MVGVWLGGWLQDSFGPATMFDVSACIVALGAIVLTIVLYLDWTRTRGGRGLEVEFPLTTIRESQDHNPRITSALRTLPGEATCLTNKYMP